MPSVENNKSVWSQRKVLVTGGSGFLGSWLTLRLVQYGAEVVGIVRGDNQNSLLSISNTRQKIRVEYGDLTDYRLVERVINERSIDTVFHLGAQAIVKKGRKAPYQTFESNIRGTYTLLDACRVHKDQVKRILVASSDKAYGYSPLLPYKEDMPLSGVDPYEVSKSCTDLVANSYAKTYGLPIVILRCGNIFGGGDLNWDRIVPGAMRALILGEILEIRSSDDFVRDYIYVEDVVDAYLYASQYLDYAKTPNTAFNISQGNPITVSELLNRIRLETNRPLEIKEQPDCAGELREQFLDSELARSELGWVPRHALAEGITKTLAWYENFLLS